MILVVGATGTIGSALVPALLQRGESVRVLSRDATNARVAFGNKVEVAEGDLGGSGVLTAALDGVDAVFLNTPSLEGFVPMQMSAIDAVVRAGVSRLVRISVIGADGESPISYSRGHYELDEHLKTTDLDWTLLAPTGFMQNLLTNAASIRQGTIYASAGDGAVSFIDARDIADVAATCLTQDGHGGRTYPLTGGTAVTYTEIAAAFQAELGHDVVYVDVPLETTRQNLLGYGLPAGQVEDIVHLFQVFQSGYAAGTTPDVSDLLGRPPRTLAEFIHDHRTAIEHA